MQSRQKLPKWEERTCVGINLCQSPSHAQSVSLVLNLLTGLVSPQFHVHHDDKFETIHDALVPKSQWQHLVGLQPTHHAVHNKESLLNIDSEENCALPDNFLKSFRFTSQEQTLTPTTAIVREDMPASEGAAENAISEQLVPSNMPEIGRSSRFRKPSLKLREIMDARALSTKTLQPDANGKHFDQSWEYRSLIGKLNYLEKSTRPDIAYAVHQCARFSATPKESHAHAVRRIRRYLLATKNLGLTQPSEHSFHCWADADFVGNWERSIAMEDINTARSRSSYLITYAACPLLWASKLQTEIAWSTTEAEYISLSTALRKVIPLMNLLSELRDNVDQNIITLPTLHCKLFEDNSGAYEIATTPKMRPRTKHINVEYHHFRAYVDKEWIFVKKVASEHQLANIFTKPLASAFFIRLRDIIMQTPNIAADQADEGV